MVDYRESHQVLWVIHLTPKTLCPAPVESNSLEVITKLQHGTKGVEGDVGMSFGLVLSKKYQT